jgi:hypothetical protein
MGEAAGNLSGVPWTGLEPSAVVLGLVTMVLKQGERPWWWLMLLLAFVIKAVHVLQGETRRCRGECLDVF